MVHARKLLSIMVSAAMISTMVAVVPAYADESAPDVAEAANQTIENVGGGTSLPPVGEIDDDGDDTKEASPVEESEPAFNQDNTGVTDPPESGGDLEASEAQIALLAETAEADASPVVDATEAISAHPDIRMRAHVQNVGWQGWQTVKADGKNAIQLGTAGRALRLEALAVSVKSAGKIKRTSVDEAGNSIEEETVLSGTVQMRAHVQNVGWQNWVSADSSDKTMAGTQGRALRVEALQLRLTGDLEKYFDIYYRVHAQNVGWMDWAHSGEAAGTEGCSLRLEALQIMLVPKDGSVAAPSPTSKHFLVSRSVSGTAHVQNIGWQGKRQGTFGTTGRALRVEAITLDAPTGMGVNGSLEYKVHVQNVGWQNYVQAGEMAGTQGRALRMEAICLRLTGDLANYYNVYYRCHVQNMGWLGWAKNGEEAGTAGLGLRMEAVQIRLVPKGMAAPGSSSGHYVTGVTGNTSVDSWLASKSRSLGSLRACFNWTSNHPHTNWAGPNARYSNQSTKWVPFEIARMRDGRPTDCYAYAATFYGLAKALGYDAKVICGWVPSRSQGRAPHSWVEIKQGGKTLVYDPGLQHSIPQRNFYAFTYGSAPTNYMF